MKKLLRAVTTSTASSSGDEERASSRILKQVLGSLRSSTPTKQRSSLLAVEGNDAGRRECSSHRSSAQCQHAHASQELNRDSPSAVSPLTPQSTVASIIDAPSPREQGTLDCSPKQLAEGEPQQLDDMQQAYESWDRYLSPAGHSLAFMTAAPVEIVDFSTDLLFHPNVHLDDDGAQEQEGDPGDPLQCPAMSSHAPYSETGDQRFTSDAEPLSTQDIGDNTTALEAAQGRDSCGALSSTTSSLVSPAHAAILANGLARQPGVNLNIDYGAEIYLTDSAPIGQGQFGSVYRGVYAGQSVAIKLLPKMFLGDASPADLETFIQEAAVLSGVDHPNVVKFYGGSLSPPYVFIVEELMERSLADVLYKAPREPFPLRRVLSTGLDVARGLHYLHRCNPAIVHRDLKPENILLDASGTAKISDFGLARCKYQSYVKTNRREAGSLAYMAPECFDARMGKLTDRLDVFSFGVLLWVMLTREFPWQGMRTHEFLQRMVIGGGRLPVPQDDNVCPLALRRLLSACWADMPAERPSCEQIISELERILKYMPAGS